MGNGVSFPDLVDVEVAIVRLRLRIPKVEPDVYPIPEKCPYEGCNGRRFKSHQEDVPKALRDTKHSQVKAQRARCLKCNRTFRIYPKGVSRDQQSDTLKGLSVLLYILGLSYGGVSDLVRALGWTLGKTTVYMNVQEAGANAQKMRKDWLKSGRRVVPVLGVDLTKVRCAGKSIVVAVAVDDVTGAELSVEILDGEDAKTIKKWLRKLAKAVGAQVLVSDDADAFKTVADELGVEHQICRAHVMRHVMGTIEELVKMVREEPGEIPEGLSVEGLLGDLERVEHVVAEHPSDGEQQLEEMHRRYQVAVSPRGKGKADVWYRMRIWTLDLWNLWGRLTLFRHWEGPNGERMDGTSNSVERAIGWGVKERYRTMRAYKRRKSVKNVSSLIGWLTDQPEDYDFGEVINY
ncbi:MAG: transposase [Chloroflexi bacterium]|nr:transposase [Chloroflexota bacterium]